MNRFIKVLDCIIDTNWLVACKLNADHTLLSIRQSENLSIEINGTAEELEKAFESIWNQLEEINKNGEKENG